MNFETGRIHFSRDVLIFCHSEILLPWQRDVRTSLYFNTCTTYIFILYFSLTFLAVLEVFVSPGTCCLFLFLVSHPSESQEERN